MPNHYGFRGNAKFKSCHGSFVLIFDHLIGHLGSPGTSVVNLTCTTNTTLNNYDPLRPFQVSLYCTWMVGKDAPEDTHYSLYYR